MSAWLASLQSSRCSGNFLVQVGPPHCEYVSIFVQLSDKLTEECVESMSTRDEIWSALI